MNIASGSIDDPEIMELICDQLVTSRVTGKRWVFKACTRFETFGVRRIWEYLRVHSPPKYRRTGLFWFEFPRKKPRTNEKR